MTHSKHTLFTFSKIESFEEFSFEDLNEGNFAQLYLMFESDNSPFVDKQFKTYAAAEEYAKYIEEYCRLKIQPVRLELAKMYC